MLDDNALGPKADVLQAGSGSQQLHNEVPKMIAVATTSLNYGGIAVESSATGTKIPPTSSDLPQSDISTSIPTQNISTQKMATDPEVSASLEVRNQNIEISTNKQPADISQASDSSKMATQTEVDISKANKSTERSTIAANSKDETSVAVISQKSTDEVSNATASKLKMDSMTSDIHETETAAESQSTTENTLTKLH